MKEWYEKKYFNRMYWIFEELENLNLDHSEACLILLIQYLNETQTPISISLLKDKMKVEEEKIDSLLDVLHKKGYLDIEVDVKGFHISIDHLFQKENELHFESNIFDLFEHEFKRPLSSSEMRRISDWLGKYEQDTIVYALRDAILRNIHSFDYINRILENGVQDEEKQ